MGIALFRLAKLLDPSDFEETARLAESVKNREMSAEFLSAWDVFLSKFGCRGPLEMDLASPRYADDPGLALRQMSFMSVDDEAFDPEAAHLRQVEEQQEAYQELMRQSGWLRRALLRRAYRIIDLFAGTRDTPKYHIVLRKTVRCGHRWPDDEASRRADGRSRRNSGCHPPAIAAEQLKN